MDLEALVERITQQVMKELEGGASHVSAPSGDSCKKLIVAESDNSGILRQLAGFGHSVVTTPGLESDAHTLGFSDVHSGRNLTDYASVLSGIREVLLPDVSLTLLSKIVNLIADTPSASVVIAALERNIPIVASLGPVAAPLAMRMAEMRRQAESMGIRFTDSSAMVSAGPSTCAFVEYRRPMAGDPDEPLGICIVRDPDTLQLFLDHGVTRFGTAMGGEPVRSPSLAQYIDHTLLKPETTKADIEKLCKEAAEYKFASVCVNPSWVPLCVELLRGSSAKVCTVIGFPLGATTTATKVAETQEAIRAGAEEIDMVINVGSLKAGDHKTVLNDIASVKHACGNKILKVILETGLLTDEEKMTACQICVEAGADFVKTSTGFGPGGATLSDIAMMRRVVGPNIGVKASGGVRDTKTAQQMIEMGATRIGASAGIAIVKGEKAKGTGY